jgi:hypothetical protein
MPAIKWADVLKSLGPPPGPVGIGATDDVWTVDHIIPLRLLRIDVSVIAWRIATHPRNVRWMTGLDNYHKRQELTPEAVGLLHELFREIKGRDMTAADGADILVTEPPPPRRPMPHATVCRECGTALVGGSGKEPLCAPCRRIVRMRQKFPGGKLCPACGRTLPPEAYSWHKQMCDECRCGNG